MEDFNDDVKPSIPLPRSVMLQSPSRPQPFEELRREQAVGGKFDGGLLIKEPKSRFASSLPAQPSQHRASTWTWKVTNVMTVPSFYPLERTSVALKDIVLDEITARISNFMRLNSITCSYRDDVAHVDCLTPCLLKFAVHLWRSNEPTNNPGAVNNSFILEISRLQGCAIEMQRLRNWLVYTVTTGEQPRSPLDHGMGSRCPSRALQEAHEQHIRFDGAGDVSKNDDDDEEGCKGALKIALRLLESECLDQNRLGLESLCVLTNPSTVCEDDADWVANAIVYGDGEEGTKLQSAIVKFFGKNERPGHASHSAASYDTIDESGFFEYAQGCTFGVMHNFCLQVLANSLERLVRSTDRNENRGSDMNCEFWKAVLPALHYNLQVAQFRPQEASLSAKSIGLLDNIEPEVLERFKEDGLIVYAEKAEDYGKVHHATLERTCNKLIATMGR